MASTCAGGTVCAKRVLKNLRDMVMTRRQLPQEKNTGKVDLMVCQPTSTPEVGAGSMAMPATPSPRSSRCCVTVPPNECPIRIGGSGNARDKAVVVIDELVDADLGESGVRRRTQLGRRAVVERPRGGDHSVAPRFVAGLEA